LIFLGALVASSDYLFGFGLKELSNADDRVPGDGGDGSVDSDQVITSAIIVYSISVIPSALSNLYKEYKMKEENMEEVR
jgi:hypothetical protein